MNIKKLHFLCKDGNVYVTQPQRGPKSKTHSRLWDKHLLKTLKNKIVKTFNINMNPESGGQIELSRGLDPAPGP